MSRQEIVEKLRKILLRNKWVKSTGKKSVTLGTGLGT